MNLTTAGGSGRLFDSAPITLQGFVFKARGVDVVGRPSLEQFRAAWDFATACEEASSYWVGDLMLYSESRADWQERLDQVVAATGLAHQTILNRTYIAKHVGQVVRDLAPSIGHASCVAALEPEDQLVWMDKARTEGWPVSELRQEIRAASRRQVIAGQASLVGQYRVIYADPPWRYRDNGATLDGSLGKAERHYPTLTIEEVCALPVAAHALPDSVLFLWVTTPLLLETPGPREVLAAWGFRYQSMLTWDKVLGLPGRFFHVTTEHLLVGERGSCAPDHPTPQPKSCYTERRGPEHSRKPVAARTMIEKLYERGPFLELFAREKAEGWDAYGNDPALWNEQGAIHDTDDNHRGAARAGSA